MAPFTTNPPPIPFLLPSTRRFLNPCPRPHPCRRPCSSSTRRTFSRLPHRDRRAMPSRQHNHRPRPR
jgi:hypothetical protein